MPSVSNKTRLENLEAAQPRNDRPLRDASVEDLLAVLRFLDYANTLTAVEKEAGRAAADRIALLLAGNGSDGFGHQGTGQAEDGGAERWTGDRSL